MVWEKLFQLTLKTLGFDPKKTNPAPCWIWPGQLNKRFEPMLTGNRNPLRFLVEYVNGHKLPYHPFTGRPLHVVRYCHLHKQCVNPFHIQCVQALKDIYETIENNPEYGFPAPLRYLWPDEFKALSAIHSEEELRILAPCNFFGSPPLP